MRKLAFLVAAASLFALGPVADRFGPVVSSLVVVWLAVVAALCASGHVAALAVVGGSVGALGSGVLASTSPAVAGAVVVAAAFAERTTRVRSRNARAIHVLLGLVTGAIAGSLASSFASAATSVYAVSVVVSAVLVSLPLLVEADDPLAHALERTALDISGDARSSLLEGAELRRTAAEIPLDRDAAANVKTTWTSLLELAEARLRLERRRVMPAGLRVADGEASADPVLAMVDRRIADQVRALSRAYAAVDTAHAAAKGLDDTAQKAVESMGESLDEVSRAMVEVRENQAG
ncbi:hypothetical protein AKJ09_01912 [Labilithrix luteola]|uniref:Uncharacterized protein n=1 Tax=Labilithrix luteola TaxID=1391654 RepID=A0A0K1PP03_9BACT|nr:hypothetical protein [Labilithrix luteola]AKU95248.1 hypothetical protein AKJ09_01912 [Labilithrix luteola]